MLSVKPLHWYSVAEQMVSWNMARNGNIFLIHQRFIGQPVCLLHEIMVFQINLLGLFEFSFKIKSWWNHSSSVCLGKCSTIFEVSTLLTLLMCLTCCPLLFLLQACMRHSRPGGSNRWNTFGWSECQFPTPQWVWIHHQSTRWKVRCFCHCVMFL